MQELFQLTPSLACKLASVVVHTEEGLSQEGHPFDLEALNAMVKDAEVKEWISGMQEASLAPLPRN